MEELGLGLTDIGDGVKAGVRRGRVGLGEGRGGSRNLRKGGGGGAQHTVFFGPPPASKLAQVPKKLISGG